MVQVGIVAICQFGGRFISNEDGSLSYVGGDAHAIDLSSDLTLEDFKSEIMSLFNINLNMISIKYFLPNNRQTLITISSDKDLHRMIDFHGGSATVDVYLLDKAIGRYATISGTVILHVVVPSHNTPRRFKIMDFGLHAGRIWVISSHRALQQILLVAIPGVGSEFPLTWIVTGQIKRAPSIDIFHSLQFF